MAGAGRPIFPLPAPPPMRLALLAALVLSALPAPAQVNTERMRRSLDDDGVRVSVDATAGYATGNTEYLRAALGGRTDWLSGPHAAFVVGQAAFSRADGATFLDRQFVHVRYGRDVGAGLAVETFAQAERNRQQLLEARTLVGAGLRAQLVARDAADFALGLTPMLESERLSERAEEDPTTAVRLSSYLSGRAAVGQATVTAVAYVQPRADAFGDARVLGQAGIEVGVTRALRLRVQANVRHDTQPPLGVEPTDVSVEQGIVVVLPPE